MPKHSRLARLQQCTTFAVLLAAAAWFTWQAPQSPLLAAAGAVLIFFGYALFLAAEFLVLRQVVRGDAVPTPSGVKLLRAWWGEACTGAGVFYWRQPFRWREEPDFLGPAAAGKRGAVFIHGFVCNRGFWTPWLRQLRSRQHAFCAVNLEPVFGAIDDYVPIVEAAVRQVADATGLPPVLICHSMGGLAARAWLRGTDAARVHRVVTIGSPHHGTWLARWSRMPNGRQMQRHGAWLKQLALDEAARPAPAFTCWYSNCDNIVFPPTTATLAGADNRLVEGAGHVDLGFRAEVMERTLRLVTTL
jgi:pimeloyl-ACP methyl ester carboxylesterase